MKKQESKTQEVEDKDKMKRQQEDIREEERMLRENKCKHANTTMVYVRLCTCE